ncbi:MAG: hypothetical protein AAFQ57_17445 [Cyanobacteria bacterium J06626_14]
MSISSWIETNTVIFKQPNPSHILVLGSLYWRSPQAHHHFMFRFITIFLVTIN